MKISNKSLSSEETRESSATEHSGSDESLEQPKKLRYPWQIFFLITTEVCERFTFYGMNAVLTVYLVKQFKKTMSEEEAEDQSTVYFHLYKSLSYFTPLLGAALADSVFGKYRTIFYLSMVYAFGSVVLSVGAIGGVPNYPNLPISFVGLFLIAVGTGGIKPCVVSLGADQFKIPEQKKEMASYFGLFYASINVGSLISTLVTPYLRKVPCMGENSCFTLAFGVPAGLMIIAVVIFFLGKSMYNIIIPERNIIVESTKCIWYALTHQKSKPKQGHWLEASLGAFDDKLVEDLQAVCRVGSIFLMYPMFWGCYDQQGSRWTIQATRMNGWTFGFQILPDQMQVSNPVMILMFIPIFDKGIYPLLGKCGILKTPLQRIVTGCFIVAVSFTASGILELELKKTYPVLPELHESRLTIHNGLDLPIRWAPGSPLGNQLNPKETVSRNVPDGTFTLSGTYDNQEIKRDIILEKERTRSIVFSSSAPVGVHIANFEDRLEKANATFPILRLLATLPPECIEANVLVKGEDDSLSYVVRETFQDFNAEQIDSYGKHTVTVQCKNGNNLMEAEAEFDVGGSYNVYVDGSVLSVYALAQPNSIHIFWLLPQYILITIGEILFSITSLEFAYSQAPKSMKSIMQAMFFLTTAVGNLITLLVVEISAMTGLEQWIEFFVFSGLLFLCTLGLALFSMRYEYVYYTEEESESEDKAPIK